MKVKKFPLHFWENYYLLIINLQALVKLHRHLKQEFVSVFGVCPVHPPPPPTTIINHPPTTLTLLNCFSAPCGQIWVCEDTFYSISGIQIWFYMANDTFRYLYLRTLLFLIATAETNPPAQCPGSAPPPEWSIRLPSAETNGGTRSTGSHTLHKTSYNLIMEFQIFQSRTIFFFYIYFWYIGRTD